MNPISTVSYATLSPSGATQGGFTTISPPTPGALEGTGYRLSIIEEIPIFGGGRGDKDEPEGLYHLLNRTDIQEGKILIVFRGGTLPRWFYQIQITGLPSDVVHALDALSQARRICGAKVVSDHLSLPNLRGPWARLMFLLGWLRHGNVAVEVAPSTRSREVSMMEPLTGNEEDDPGEDSCWCEEGAHLS